MLWVLIIVRWPLMWIFDPLFLRTLLQGLKGDGMIKMRMNIFFMAGVVFFAGISVCAAEMTLTSRSFKHHEDIPARFTCQGEDISPELSINGLPDGAKSLVLIVDDPDAPVGTWVHWVVINIPLTETIREASVPGDQVVNNFRRRDYGGPCPPNGKHRYFFKLFALDAEISLIPQMTPKDVESAMQGHVLAQAVLVGLYEKK